MLLLLRANKVYVLRTPALSATTLAPIATAYVIGIRSCRQANGCIPLLLKSNRPCKRAELCPKPKPIVKKRGGVQRFENFFA